MTQKGNNGEGKINKQRGYHQLQDSNMIASSAQNIMQAPFQTQQSMQNLHQQQMFLPYSQQQDATGSNPVNRYTFMQSQQPSFISGMPSYAGSSSSSNLNQMYAPLTSSFSSSHQLHTNPQKPRQTISGIYGISNEDQINLNQRRTLSSSHPVQIARSISASNDNRSPTLVGSSSHYNIISSSKNNDFGSEREQGSSQGMYRGTSEPNNFPSLLQQDVHHRHGLQSIETGNQFNNHLSNQFPTMISSEPFHEDGRINFPLSQLSEPNRIIDQRSSRMSNLTGMPIPSLDSASSSFMNHSTIQQQSQLPSSFDQSTSNFVAPFGMTQNVDTSNTNFRHPSTSSSSSTSSIARSIATTTSTTTTAPTTQKRVPAACNFCRIRKLRCDGSTPCRQCTRRMIECVYSQEAESRKQRRRATVSTSSPTSSLTSNIATNMTSSIITPIMSTTANSTNMKDNLGITPLYQKTAAAFEPLSIQSHQQQQQQQQQQSQTPQSTINFSSMPYSQSFSELTAFQPISAGIGQIQRNVRPVSRHSEPSSFSVRPRQQQQHQQAQMHASSSQFIQPNQPFSNRPTGIPTNWTAGVPLYAPQQRNLSDSNPSSNESTAYPQSNPDPNQSFQSSFQGNR